ncbi:RNA-binding protein Cwf29 [Coemansia sp. RSA 986]|nr:RNA-binding protein Cwf29 [Coemansia sp. RSA 986]
MNVVQEIRRINENEQRLGSTASWHDEYKDSAYIFVGGLSYDLTEGDVICVFSQYGEIVNVNLVRDKETGASKGFAFLQYEDQRSTVLAVDNLNGFKLLGRVLRVDHVKNYRQPKQADKDGEEVLPMERVMNAAPQPIRRSADADADADADGDGDGGGDGSDSELMKTAGIDPEDPMANYYLEKHKRRIKKELKRHKIRSDHVITAPATVPLKILLDPQAGETNSEQTDTDTSGRTPSRHPMFIGIGGGRGAGKEYTCRYVINKVRERGYTELAGRVVHLHMDDFHRELSPEDRELLDSGKMLINFDHPESYDFARLASVLQNLKNGVPVEVPEWDGKRLRHTGAVRRIECLPRVVLVEGTLVLFANEVRRFMDMQVFVDVDSDIRLSRQLSACLGDENPGSDKEKSNLLVHSFLDAYLQMGKPCFEEFIWPTKRWADVIIPKGDRNNVAIELIAQRLIDLDA